jgi:hypothetical protein
MQNKSRSFSGLPRWPMPRVLGDLTGGQSSDNRAGVGADVGRKIVKFKAEVEVNLPEDLNKYTGTPEGSLISYVHALAKMQLTLDLTEALRLYGMDAKTVSVVKAHS